MQRLGRRAQHRQRFGSGRHDRAPGRAIEIARLASGLETQAQTRRHVIQFVKMRDIGDQTTLRQKSQMIGERTEISQTTRHVGEVQNAFDGRVGGDGVFLRERHAVGDLELGFEAVFQMPGAVSPRGPQCFVQFRHHQNAKNRHATRDGANRNAPGRDSAREVGGAVNRVNDPARRVGVAAQAAFLAQKTPIGRECAEFGSQKGFDGAVGVGHERVVALDFHARRRFHFERQSLGTARDVERGFNGKRESKIRHRRAVYLWPVARRVAGIGKLRPMFRVVVPQIFENMEEATIGRWMVAPGQSVALEQPLCELITEKTTLDLPSEFEGVVRQLVVAEKAVVPVGFVIALIGDENEDLPDVDAQNASLKGVSPAIEAPKIEIAAPKTEVVASSGRLRATPAARRAAREAKVELEAVAAQFPGKVLSEEDVKAFAQSL